MSSSSPTKIAFLLGSGVSIPAGMPTTDEITERVLSGGGIFSSGETFTKHKSTYIKEENVSQIVKLLHKLKTEIEEYYKKHKFKLDTNYEDLYYMTRQIYDSQAGEYDNPAVQPLVDKILPDIKSLLEKTNTRSEWTLSKLAEAAMKYIEYVVFHLINTEPKPLDYLSCIKEACEDKDFSKVDIFTLNHDTVLEKCLKKQNGIQFTDGFFKPEREEHRYWKPSLFNSRSFKVRIFKLHGSINWFRFRLEDAIDWSGESIAIPSGMINYLITDAKGRILRALDKRPLLLVGTYNKMLEYNSGIYRELHYQFYRSLSNVKQLVICGYGLGDRGINTQVVDWLYSSNNRRIIVVDPRPETLENKYLSSISNKWDILISTNKLRVLPKGIKQTSWQEIKNILFENVRQS